MGSPGRSVVPQPGPHPLLLKPYSQAAVASGVCLRKVAEGARALEPLLVRLWLRLRRQTHNKAAH